ncbi:hypothetical protein BJY01DRAFT_219473 [Aspergillus pseudoustus]|uniref:RRM domain-containing protein n=1 Tax=Aspergillus pseudoustus TaxID=1810923 RepID=A0ABR4JG78_9EURO
MLQPFLIRDLHDDPQQQDIVDDTASDLYNASDIISIGPHRRHGLVQLSAADYDEIAYIHPQARLTYLDEDDGEMITVGSALELSQRLDEPPVHEADTGFPETIHLFDIRRRKSVVDLWKRFGLRERTESPETLNTNNSVENLDDRSITPVATTSRDVASHVEHTQANTAEDDTSESFLSAFEAEMSKVMNEPQPMPQSNAVESGIPSTAPQAESTSSLPRETADAFATALRNLIEVAELISSGVRSQLPELERHLENARRALPSDITDPMRNAFLLFEEQIKAMAATLNTIPETIRRESGPGGARRFPEFPEFPAPQTAIRGLREMGAQLGGMGQSLLDVFESSVRGAFPGQLDNYFPNLPNFSDANGQSGSQNNSAEHTSDNRDNTSSGSEVRSDTVPAAQPSQDDSAGARQPFIVSGEAKGSSRDAQQPAQPYPFSNSFVHDPPSWSPWWLPPQTPFQQPHPFWGHRPPRHHRPHFPPGPPNHFPPFHPPHPYPGPRSDVSEQPQRPVSQSPLDNRRGSDPHSTRSLFIGNIGYTVTERMVRDVFTSRGFAVDVSLPLESRTGKHAGFGYLIFSTAAEATLALRDFQGIVIDGHSINLEYVDHSPITSLPGQGQGVRSNPATAVSPQTSGVVRRDTGQTNATPSVNTAPNDSVHDLLLAETEARFPPVSQLDAHMLAEQSTAPRGPQSANSPDTRELSQGPPVENADPSQPLPGAFPQDDLSPAPGAPTQTFNTHPRTLHHHHHRHLHRSQSQAHFPRRAATVRAPEPRRVSFDPFDTQPTLRRRATERHSLRNGSRMSSFDPRHSASNPHPSQRSRPQSQNVPSHEEEPSEEVSRRQAEKQARKQRAIDECVASLVQLGYGNEEGGGPQRMAVYAAAANGELVDAIEMIEEERKAYEERG